MAFQVSLSIFTALLTAFAWWTVRGARVEWDRARQEHLKVQRAIAQHDLMREEIDGVKQRIEKLAGRFYREKRTERELQPPEPDVDEGVAQLLAFQTAPPAKPN